MILATHGVGGAHGRREDAKGGLPVLMQKGEMHRMEKTGVKIGQSKDK
jgi:hypothetical protein